MRLEYLTAESEIRGITYVLAVPTQEGAVAFIEYGIDVQIMNPNENLEMLYTGCVIEPRVQDLVFPLIEPKENHPYGWYRKFEKKKRYRYSV